MAILVDGVTIQWNVADIAIQRQLREADSRSTLSLRSVAQGRLSGLKPFGMTIVMVGGRSTKSKSKAKSQEPTASFIAWDLDPTEQARGSYKFAAHATAAVRAEGWN